MKLNTWFLMITAAMLILSLGAVVACGDDDDDDDDSSSGDDDSGDDDSGDDDSGDDDSSGDDLVGDCQDLYASCGVDDGGVCDSLSSYEGLGECWTSAVSAYFDCLAAEECVDSDGSCSTDFISAIEGC